MAVAEFHMSAAECFTTGYLIEDFALYSHFFSIKDKDLTCMEEKNTDQKTAEKSKEDAAKNREERLTKLEEEVANIKNKISECTQGMKDAQDTLAKVGNICFQSCQMSSIVQSFSPVSLNYSFN